MFTAAGPVKVKIDDVKFAEPKFAQGPNDFDICVHVVAVEDSAQSDWWRGEVSQNYGKGNFATQTQAEITMMTLRKVGFEGDDLTQLASQIVGKETVAMIKSREHEGKVYYSVQYIGSGGGDQPVEIDVATMQSKLSAMFGDGSAKAAPEPAPAAKSAVNPFAKNK